jgi:uncharacterized membrane protein YjdF
MTDTDKPDREQLIHKWIAILLLLIAGVEWVLLMLDMRWLSLFLVSLIILVLVSPILFRRKLNVEIPVEFHLTAVVFTFAALYFGEIHSFYHHLWWWDIALHATAGLLMGIFGFLLVYLLNETRKVDVHMTPGFIAFFAFCFSMTIGVFWEIFEFAVDQLMGTQMQKPMLGDPSGLTDTMWDLIVNAMGAALISITGWWYLKTDQTFFVREWIGKFIRKNPRLFKK